MKHHEVKVFSTLFSGGNSSIDCDATAIICVSNGKMKELVYFGNLNYGNGAVVHQGDNLTADGDGDDEQIMVDLNRLQSNITKIMFIVNIYDEAKKRQHFGMIQNAFIRLVDMSNNNEICGFNLPEKCYGMEDFVVGEIYSYSDEWKFDAIGQPVISASRIHEISA